VIQERRRRRFPMIIDMTITDYTTATTAPLRPVAVDLVPGHPQGIRSELFAITKRAGNLDPSDVVDRRDLACHVQEALASRLDV